MPLDLAFTKSLPKVELHAHLTGSITRECLHEIWLLRKAEEPDFNLSDPMEVLPDGKTDFDVNTFFPLFTNQIYALLSRNLHHITLSTTRVLEAFQTDGVIYLELRTTPRSSPFFTAHDYISTILAAIDAYNTSQPSLRTYLILSLDRRHSPAQMEEVVNLAIAFKGRGVVGIDLCGNPVVPISIATLEPLIARAKAAGLAFVTHFAETVQSASEEELEGLLRMGPRRLGHVVHVGEEMRRRIIRMGVGVEICLSCNVLAGLTLGGWEGHHFLDWWSGAAAAADKEDGERPNVVLCTDDTGIFLSPLSNEYLLAAQHYNLSKRDLLHMCQSAGNMILAGEEERRRIRGMVEERKRLDC